MPSPLSRQEKKLVEAAADGKTDKESARLFDVAVGTIRTYWERIRQKLSTVNRTHSVAKEIRAENQDELQKKDAKIAELKSKLDD
jgi:DNA-binding CsgD family transcriptional regulator